MLQKVSIGVRMESMHNDQLTAPGQITSINALFLGAKHV